MCVYDITELDEDEAIVSVLNTESSVVCHPLCVCHCDPLCVTVTPMCVCHCDPVCVTVTPLCVSLLPLCV